MTGRQERIPQHIAIILDGNGRWAKRRNLPRTQGHIEGVKRVEEIVDAAQATGVKVLTLYTFSTENWSRPAAEVSMLMDLLTAVLSRKIDKLQKNNLRFQTIGRTDKIPDSVLKMIHDVSERTRDNTGLIINLAFNYGSRTEIVDAFQDIVRKVKSNEISIEDINETMVGQHLYTKNLPDPDLLIRTSGEKRISNFLLWQLSYAEFYFTDKCWPDFNTNEFQKAIDDYASRERRFGSLGKEGEDE